MLHHKQVFSNNDIEANNNNVTFKTNLASSAGPALTLLAATVSFMLLVAFVTALVTHWQNFVNILLVAMYVIVGLGLTLMAVWVFHKCWIFVSHAYAEWVFSRDQKRRNSVYSVGQNHVVYDETASVSVAKLSERVTHNYADREHRDNVVEADVSRFVIAPSFNQILHDGSLVKLASENQSKTAADMKFCYGFTPEGPRVVNFGDVRSLVISGMNGVGKTVTMSFIGTQAALYGFKLVIVDPHMNNEQGIANRMKSLQYRMVCEPTDDTNCQQTFQLLANELANRKASKSSQYDPWLVIIDEVPGIVRTYREDKETLTLIQRTIVSLNDEGRKFGMFVVAAGQRWKAASSGSAEIRQSFPAQMQHKNAAPEVDLLLGCTASEALIGARLKAGQVIMCDSIEAMTFLSIPLITAADIEEVASIAQQRYGSVSLRRPRNVLETHEMEDEIDPETASEAKLEAFRNLLSQNAPKSRFMTEIWGAKPGDNLKYNTFMREYDEYLELVSIEQGA